MIEIRKCKSNEITSVMSFIDKHWKKNHALAKSKKLINWQHKSSDGAYNFIIAINKDNILGILGYINHSRFCKTSNNSIVWLALWKIKDGLGIQGLGLKLLNKLKEIEKPSFIGVNGINKLHPPMYKALGYKTIELKCFFFINPKIESNLILNKNLVDLIIPNKNTSVLIEMTANDLKNLNKLKHHLKIDNPKSTKYFIKRFLEHPFYKYRVFKILGADHGDALIATRVVMHKNSKALKIVDFAGDLSAIEYMGFPLLQKIIEENIEYVDFWQYGIEDNALLFSGFNKLDDNSPLILPNYYEPFVKENTKILSAFKSHSSNAFIFRADGDQDRPNII